MDKDPEDRHLVDLMLGCKVVVEYLAGPMIPEDKFDPVVKEGEVLTGQPEARTRACWLRGYNNFGIEVTPTIEQENCIFISWSAVLRLWGQDWPKLEQAHREFMQQEGSEEAR
jgi:hypothetical protein